MAVLDSSLSQLMPIIQKSLDSNICWINTATYQLYLRPDIFLEAQTLKGTYIPTALLKININKGNTSVLKGTYMYLNFTDKIV